MPDAILRDLAFFIRLLMNLGYCLYFNFGISMNFMAFKSLILYEWNSSFI